MVTAVAQALELACLQFISGGGPSRDSPAKPPPSATEPHHHHHRPPLLVVRGPHSRGVFSLGVARRRKLTALGVELEPANPVRHRRG